MLLAATGAISQITRVTLASVFLDTAHDVALPAKLMLQAGGSQNFSHPT